MAWSLRRQRSTGWLDLSQHLLNGWAGTIIGIRTEDTVHLDVHALAAADATSENVFDLPSAMRAVIPGSTSVSARFLLHLADSGPTIRRGWVRGGNTIALSGYQPADVLYGQIDYPTIAVMGAVEGVKL